MAVLVLLGVVIVGGAVNITLVLVVVFVMGTAEVFANTAAATLPPMLVTRDDLALANARLQTGFVTVYQLAGVTAPTRRCSVAGDGLDLSLHDGSAAVVGHGTSRCSPRTTGSVAF